jgi:hypothetical protein
MVGSTITDTPAVTAGLKLYLHLYSASLITVFVHLKCRKLLSSKAAYISGLLCSFPESLASSTRHLRQFK